jgi:tRNA 2-selenouridine synthase SelU
MNLTSHITGLDYWLNTDMKREFSVLWVKLGITKTPCLNENELHIETSIDLYTAGTKRTRATRESVDTSRLYEETVKVNPAYFTMKSAFWLVIYNVQEARLRKLIFALFSISIVGSKERMEVRETHGWRDTKLMYHFCYSGCCQNMGRWV